MEKDFASTAGITNEISTDSNDCSDYLMIAGITMVATVSWVSMYLGYTSSTLLAGEARYEYLQYIMIGT